MTEEALPKLLEDGSLLDWPDATYSAQVWPRAGHARISHHLLDAPALDRLIDEGSAQWAVELRCPRTLLSRVEVGPGSEMDIRWDTNEVSGLVYLTPGLLATRDISLDTNDLDNLFRDKDVIDVPGGWWLARGTTRRTQTLLESLLTFQKNPDLDPGQMRIASDESGGRLRFIVFVAPDIFEGARGGDRSLQVAGLIGVCALFQREFGEDAKEKHGALIDEIRERLISVGVPTWEDEQYDPAQAATAIERFLPREIREDIDDE